MNNRDGFCGCMPSIIVIIISSVIVCSVAGQVDFGHICLGVFLGYVICCIEQNAHPIEKWLKSERRLSRQEEKYKNLATLIIAIIGLLGLIIILMGFFTLLGGLIAKLTGNIILGILCGIIPAILYCYFHRDFFK